MSTPVHRVRAASEPKPGTWSRPRVYAAVSRIVRHHARATDDIGAVFGRSSVTARALRTRVEALSAARARDRQKATARLHQFAVWLAAACETIELEDDAAADLHVHLAVIVAECERIANVAVAEPETECDDKEADSAA